MRSELAVIAITLAVALLVSTTPAKAGKPTTIVTPFDDNLVNSCTGETVHVTGTVTSSFDTETRNGILHSKTRQVFDLDGVGLTSGNNYSLHVVTNATSSGKLDGGTGELNVTENLRFISQGGDDNLLLSINQHITINANGDIIVLRTDTADIVCVG